MKNDNEKQVKESKLYFQKMLMKCASLLAVYENFTREIDRNIMFLYNSCDYGLYYDCLNKEETSFSDKYILEVLHLDKTFIKKNMNPYNEKTSNKDIIKRKEGRFKANIEWCINQNLITKEEKQEIEKIRKKRNEIAHDLLNVLEYEKLEIIEYSINKIKEIDILFNKRWIYEFENDDENVTLESIDPGVQLIYLLLDLIVD